MLLPENSVCGSDDGTRTKLECVVVVAQRNETKRVRVYLAICQPRSTSIVYSLFSLSLVKRRTFSHSSTLNQQTDRAGTNRCSIPIAIACSSCSAGVELVGR